VVILDRFEYNMITMMMMRIIIINVIVMRFLLNSFLKAGGGGEGSCLVCYSSREKGGIFSNVYA
jgi:hypothetical protein